VFGWENTGTLARAPLAGGAPREVLEDVEEADWSPDGRSLAVVRDVAGRRQIEFPIDKVLYATGGYVSHIRVSPKGDRIAFLDHAQRGDNGGSVCLVDLAGGLQRLTGVYLGTEGMAWGPSGNEVWFAAAPEGNKYELRAVSLDKKERLVWREGGPVSLHDISRDGTVLLSRQYQTREMAGLAPGAVAERDLSWFDWSYPMTLSSDGQTLLFDEEGEGGGTVYSVYLRKTDGSPAVRLGEGSALALAPDGKTALVGTSNGLLMIQIGAGQPRPLPTGNLTIQAAVFFGDGQRLLIAANEPGHGSRLFTMGLTGEPPRPFTPEGVGFTLGSSPLSPDGKLAAAFDAERRIALFAVDGGEPRMVPATTTDEQVVGWTADGRGLYVRQNELPTRVEIVDLANGRRTPWRTLAPADPAGVFPISPILISADGRSYVYSYKRLTEDLYVVGGLK